METVILLGMIYGYWSVVIHSCIPYQPAFVRAARHGNPLECCARSQSSGQGAEVPNCMLAFCGLLRHENKLIW